MSTAFIVLGAIVAAWVLAYHRASATAWTIATTAGLVAAARFAALSFAALAALWLVFAALIALLAPTALRRTLVSRHVLAIFARLLPPISQTEQEALDAGSAWWEAELLSGNPAWERLSALPPAALTEEEQAFLDGPVDELCEMLDEWRITRELHDLPREAWAFIKRTGLQGMIIPKAYGGLGFSAQAHSAVIMKLATRSGTAAVSVMVPNSLGPAELLLHYGTQDQKDYYLPRLAQGEETPCFALTNPQAGSDAASIPDFGVVCRGTWNGAANILGIRLTWDKRYITLAPVATVLGIAFRLYDPDHLIGPHDDVGITLALIPADTPGVHVGRRHLPMNAAFMNGPTWGRDVFISMDQVIGGVEQVGSGWRMLMNCLAAGRGISLPAYSCGAAKLSALVSGAYARVRCQFDQPIARFDAVQSVLARIAGTTYVMDAVRTLTAQAIDAGEKPAVISAIAKYHLTERVRKVVNDAMDLHGGKAICMGPRNYLAALYEQIPIGVTVEGANLLTRAMIIFGQGLVRGHPYLIHEIRAARESASARSLREFDEALFGHVAFLASNVARTLWLGLTAGRLAHAPGNRHTRSFYRQLTRFSSALALASDVVLLVVGGALKRRERLSARLGDILSLLYLGTAVLLRYEHDGCREEDLPLVHWAMRDTFSKMEQAFRALIENLPGRWTGWVLRGLIFPRVGYHGAEFEPPDDELESRVAALISESGMVRKRLTRGVFVSSSAADAVALLERAFAAALAAEPAEDKMRRSRRGGTLTNRSLDEATALGIISAAESELVKRADALRRETIAVDDFSHELDASRDRQTTQTFETMAHHK